MNQRNNSGLVAAVAVLATLIAVVFIVVALILANVIPFGSTETGQNIEQVSSEQTESDISPNVVESVEPSKTYDQPTTMYVANVKNSIYLRSEPIEDESNIITTIPVGAQVVWLENTNTVFSEISYGGVTGYVKRDYLSAKKPQENTVSSGNTTVYKYMYVANVENSIYLRSTAAEESNNIITTIPVGTQIGYIERTNGVFSKINYNGTIGYAKTIYLSDYNTRYKYLTVYNVKKAIYLRSAPQENPNNIICEIPLGSVVRYLGDANGGFYKISYDGYVGYSKSIYLK